MYKHDVATWCTSAGIFKTITVVHIDNLFLKLNHNAEVTLLSDVYKIITKTKILCDLIMHTQSMQTLKCVQYY